ncbi:hypothetical protein [Streptomyces goshikiensis]|uniref:hypothetical protein n=1 Tax=Streptomyces goshikiensis TaxID=1942 RepID=UPI00371C2B64
MADHDSNRLNGQPAELSEVQLAALIDAGNGARNDYYHERACSCSKWPESCATNPDYANGYWDSDTFAIAAAAVIGAWESMRTPAASALMDDERIALIRKRRTHCERARLETEDERPLHVWGPSDHPGRDMCQRCTTERAWAEDVTADEVVLLAEVDRLRARVAELEALTPAAIQTCRVCGAGYDLGQPCSTCMFKAQMAAATADLPEATRG